MPDLQKTGDTTSTCPPVELPLAQWPAALLEPRCSVSVDLSGVPGYFPAPRGWSAHVDRLDHHLMYHVVTGGFQARVRGQLIRAAAGSVLWVGPGRSFSAERVDQDPLVLLRFRFSLGVPGPVRVPPHGVVCRHRMPQARGWFESVVVEVQRIDAHVETRLRGLLACLLVELARHAVEPSGERHLTAAQQRALQDYVARRMTDWPTLAQLASVVGLSPDYFSRVFRQTYGRSVRQWVVDQRIRLARLYLAESCHDVTGIAAMLGYNDVFYFSRQFKARVGVSPSAYRKRLAGHG